MPAEDDVIDFNALVISLPGREVDSLPFMGSVFDAGILKNVPLSPDVRLAMDVLAARVAGGKSLRCVARPEMFTHGAALHWLQERLSGVTEHVSLSDGTSVKLIPGLRNHLFTYGLQSTQRCHHFELLLRQAPEWLPQYESQINSFHRVKLQGQWIEPAPELMLGTAPDGAPTIWFYGFYLNPHSVQDSTDRMLSWGEFEDIKLSTATRVTYIPITDCAIRDARFQLAVAEAIAQTYFEPESCLLIRMPLSAAELPLRMNDALEAIRSAGLRLPRVRAQNVFILAEDLPETSLAPLGERVSFLLHESYEFWRYSESVYRRASSIHYYQDPQSSLPADGARQTLGVALGTRITFPASERDPASAAARAP